MLVRNESNGRMIDTDANMSGEARYDFATAWDVAHMIDSKVRLAEYYRSSNVTLRSRMNDVWAAEQATRDAAHAFITWLGDESSQHAKDNDLCANYERFLSGGIGEYVKNEDNADYSRELARTFVRHAARVREYELTVSKTVRRVGRGANEWSAQMDAAQTSDPYAFRVEDSDVVAVVLSDYDEVQARNESFARRGDYNIVTPVQNNDGNDERPSNPYDGQVYVNGQGMRFVWCAGCDCWHED